MRIRPMRADDIDAAERVTARAFAPDGPPRSALAKQRWTGRLAHILAVDRDGCWVAENDSGVIGVAASLRRDKLWVLSTFAIDPDHQGRGAGKALLDAAVGYSQGCLRGMLCAMPHPGALRLYRNAGFNLHPTMCLTGVVTGDVVPDVRGVRLAGESDLDLVDSVDRRARDATHRPDHAIMASYGPLLICDIMNGSGYAYLDRATIGPLAATSRAVAQRLMWAALAQIPPGEEVKVRYLTSEQEWALDVGLAAGLRIEQDGFLAFRHMRPPMPYIPSVPFG
ncbi:GNAT family N-acetyltransferase [Phytoactinopolyspora mesophila]|uniref:GNAT family N-acetyltransferase n=1 Tax=Phytoactinopolyspora mesophila TaxID=2650750 RepID=A0A7K3M1X7_9ACTN|nr:GNAT family N-acetyltransferase [Phytoactinopolyspora mesophila]NDL57279.1 GNAT family N-acetyltransferase [Phytoactinopolyspora mesophila]